MSSDKVFQGLRWVPALVSFFFFLQEIKSSESLLDSSTLYRKVIFTVVQDLFLNCRIMTSERLASTALILCTSTKAIFNGGQSRAQN